MYSQIRHYLLTLKDVTYFFELLGITDLFTVVAVLFSVSSIMCGIGFFTIEVLHLPE